MFFLLDEIVKVCAVNLVPIAELEVWNPARPDEIADAPDRTTQVSRSALHCEESRSIGEFIHAPTIANERSTVTEIRLPSLAS